MDDIVIIIPAYKPQKEIMMPFIKSVKEEFKHVVVVNDGCGQAYDSFFEEIERQDFIVLKHYVNLGKGRAIKTAFNYVLNNYPNIIGVVTADCDGQHALEDIKKCAQKLRENPDKLIVGCRNFNESQVPLKSRYGNKITIFTLSTFVGIKISDSQSGLRAFGKTIMEKFMQVSGERYEYETNMLISCKENNFQIAEVPISTIYIEGNTHSHFNPIKDSIVIYKIFIKYILSAISSFLLDIALFTIFVNVFPDFSINEIITKIVIATIIARIISSIYNFCINSKLVFKNNKTKKSLLKYFTLVIIQMFVSAFAVSELFKIIGINSTLIKLVVDTIIFIVNFVIQREWVFKK